MKIKVDNREHTLIKLLKALNKDYEFNLDMMHVGLGVKKDVNSSPAV